MRNIALLIEYDGTAYGGWQRQKNSNTVQEVIEKILSRLLQEEVKITGSGRTDAGVHARGQVANFKTGCSWEPGKLVYALNGNLPEDIAVRDAAEVPHDFDSRFSAIARHYSYKIISRKSPLIRTSAAFFPHELSVGKMNEAATALVGKKSFKAFTSHAAEIEKFVCDVFRAEWREEEPASGRDGEPEINSGGGSSPVPRFPVSPILSFSIEANRFLHGMVRAIVGTMVDVGRGKISDEDFRRIVGSEDRTRASMSAPAKGLCLEEVRYGIEIWKRVG